MDTQPVSLPDPVASFLHYQQFARRRSENTLKAQRGILTRADKFLYLHTGHGLAKATEQELLAWQLALTVGPDSLSSYVSAIKTFYNWQIKTKQRTDNPAAFLEAPPRMLGRPKPITQVDLDRAIDLAPPRIRRWLIWGAYAGLRAREVAYQTREDILDTGRPMLLHVTRYAAKGRRDRVVPMSPYVWTEMRVLGLPRRGWTSPRQDGLPGPTPPHIVSQMVADHLEDATGRRWTMHSLRHYFGTAMYQSTKDIYLVKELLGHASATTTAIYALITIDQDAADAVAAISPQHLRIAKGQ